MLLINSGQQQFAIEQKDHLWFVNEQPVTFDCVPVGADSFSLIINGHSYNATIEQIDRISKTITININGNSYPMEISEPIDQLIKKMGLDTSSFKKAEAIKAPMPGMVLKVLVKADDEVQKGESLIVLEAMKMENMLKAPAAGKVKKIFVEERTAVEKGTVLIEME